MTPQSSPVPKPVVLAILDGFGASPETRGNAIHAAETPALERIERDYPFLTLQASGIAVGLPWGEPGNSEVGHLTIGAGRPIYHHLPRIIMAIQDGSFFENPAFSHVLDQVAQNRSGLHLIGLVSSGSVHSYLDHLFALLELARRRGVSPVFLHAITDGRDAPPQGGRKLIAELQSRMQHDFPGVRVASLVGRFFAMDRDSNWDRIRQAYELFTRGQGLGYRGPAEYLKNCYASGTGDEFIPPGFLADEHGAPVGRIQAGDGVIFFNFREDSMRELVSAFVQEPFSGFERQRVSDLAIATMTRYTKGLTGVYAAFEPLEIAMPLARVLADAKKSQLHIAETEKYAHATYFFNGGVEAAFPGEDRILVPSAGVPRFDQAPEMRAQEITEKIIERIGAYDFILANYANADMVGHTGNFPAIVKAVEALDENLDRLQVAVINAGGALLISADHGNAEEKRHPISGEKITAHTPNPVPLYLIGQAWKRAEPRQDPEIRQIKREPAGILSDIAPTILDLIELEKPPEMTGKSLLPLLTQRG